LTVRIYI